MSLGRRGPRFTGDLSRYRLEHPGNAAVLNDNNFPASGGRSTTAPDENELILIRLDEPLDVARGILPR